MAATDELDKPSFMHRLCTQGEDIELTLGEHLIGRAPECDLVVDDALVSRHHARIRCDERGAVFEDLGSRNGSRINGEPVRGARALEHGDHIQLGARDLIYSQESAFSEVRIPVARRVAAERAHSDAELASGRWAIEEQITLIAWVEPGREESSVRWPVEMLVELLGKAMLSGRQRDVSGLIEQAVISVNRALEMKEPLRLTDLEALRDAAKWLARVERSDRWPSWIAETYARAGYEATLDDFETHAPSGRSESNRLANQNGGAGHTWKGRSNRR